MFLAILVKEKTFLKHIEIQALHLMLIHIYYIFTSLVHLASFYLFFGRQHTRRYYCRSICWWQNQPLCGHLHSKRRERAWCYLCASECYRRPRWVLTSAVMPHIWRHGTAYRFCICIFSSFWSVLWWDCVVWFHTDGQLNSTVLLSYSLIKVHGLR